VYTLCTVGEEGGGGWRDCYTVVGDYFNIMKTTFDFNFEVFPAFEQQEYIKTRKIREAVN